MKLALDIVNLAYWLHVKDSEGSMNLGVWEKIYYILALTILGLQIFVSKYLIWS